MRHYIYARNREHAPNGGDMSLPICEYDHAETLHEALERFSRDFGVPYDKASVHFRASTSTPYQIREHLWKHKKIWINTGAGPME